jgi:preprotein translocase subunit SecA
MRTRDDVIVLITEKAREAYRRREVEYPVEHTLLFAFGGEEGSTDNPYAADYVKSWINRRYGVEISLDHIRSLSVRKLKDEVSKHQADWLADNGKKIELEVDRLLRENPTPETLTTAFNQRFETKFTLADMKELQNPTPLPPAGAEPTTAPSSPQPRTLTPEPFRNHLLHIAREFFRKELTDLEQFVLIQILDTSWKDHLYAMDLLKSGIGLQAFAERDPRVMYKKEGYRYFQEMLAGVRDKVTDLIFRARIMGPTQAKNAYNVTAAVHEDTGGYGVAENLERQAQLTPHEAQMVAAAEQGEGGEVAAVKTITRNEPRVGRNDLCPCGSGKKYKKCCGVNAA